jgi:hypothetical protein
VPHFKEEQKMTKRMEQTQNAKKVQLALFREYGFQPCLKDIKILNTRDFDEFLAVLMGLKGLEIEICGSWLWIGGETKENKDALKGAGCRWASKKKLWYWHAGEWVKKVRRALTMEQIRDLHGSEFLKYRPETPLLQ